MRIIVGYQNSAVDDKQPYMSQNHTATCSFEAKPHCHFEKNNEKQSIRAVSRQTITLSLVFTLLHHLASFHGIQSLNTTLITAWSVLNTCQPLYQEDPSHHIICFSKICNYQFSEIYKAAVANYKAANHANNRRLSKFRRLQRRGKNVCPYGQRLYVQSYLWY
jgi:hypothetical protein